MDGVLSAAQRVIEECRAIAQYTEEPGFTTRTFLSPPMRDVHRRLAAWMEQAGMTVTTDAAGNLRGVYPGTVARRLFIGSHLDTVPHAGAFDGILGVVLAIALVESLEKKRLKFSIEVVGFSEEEGVRFGIPFIGSRALAGLFDGELLQQRDANGISASEAIRQFGLNPADIPRAAADGDAVGYLEFHIEQGPVLDTHGLPLGIVESIVGQSRLEFQFDGQANHAGTTPMNLRRDALAGAAEWITAVEREALATPGLVATVGRVEIAPGASNVIAGNVRASLDVRHAVDAIRHRTVEKLKSCAAEIAARRGLSLDVHTRLDQAAVAMDPRLVEMLEHAVAATGYPVYRMSSGAGHDAMILAQRMPAAMLFVRSPGGISHHPGETVLAEDAAAALAVGARFLNELETC